MISDTLCDAITKIDRYLEQDNFYTGRFRERALEVREAMYLLQIELDMPPPVWEALNAQPGDLTREELESGYERVTREHLAKAETT